MLSMTFEYISVSLIYFSSSANNKHKQNKMSILSGTINFQYSFDFGFPIALFPIIPMECNFNQQIFICFEFSYRFDYITSRVQRRVVSIISYSADL